MAKNTPSNQTSQVDAFAIQPKLINFLQVIGLPLVLSGFFWLALNYLWDAANKSSSSFLNIFSWLGLSVLLGVIVRIIALSWLRAKIAKDDTTFRLAFAAGIGMAIGGWIYFQMQSQFTPNPSWLWMILLGAFVGGLSASGSQYGIIEDNFPPPAEVEAEVRRKTMMVIKKVEKTPLTKRWFDILLAGIGLALSFPVWILLSLLIWIENPGPIVFIKNSVGLGGENFRQYKFRTMVREAERKTGPIQAPKEDERVLWIGKILRKTAMDELPQLVNILKGEMSFVGPRPLRTVMVNDFLDEVPGYAYRHQTLPGIAGLAQILGDSYLENKNKVRYDRLYAKNASLGFDIRLIGLAFLTVFWLRWQKDWDGHIPRRWVKIWRRGRK